MELTLTADMRIVPGEIAELLNEVIVFFANDL